MDSPERSTAGGTPISKFEDSPFYNFVNSLSPIQPVKSGHSIQAFHSPSFAAISSVFSSPHVSLQKESRFLIRQPFPDSVKQDAFSDSLDENTRSPGIPIGDVLSTCKVLAQENANMTCSLNKATIDPADESSTQSHFSQPVQFDNGSPNHNTTPCYSIKLDFKLDVTCAPSTLVELVQAEDGLDGPKISLTEIGRNVESHKDQIKEDVPGNEWKNLISDNSDDLLNFDANGSETSEIQEKDYIISLKSQSVASYGLCVQNVLVDSFMDDVVDTGDENRMHRTPKLLPDTCQNQEILNVQNQETEVGLNDCVLGSKVDSQQHRGVRRRCLVFEVAGVSKKNQLSNLNVPPSMKLPTNEFASDDPQPISSKPLKAPVPRILPGIGLHLNALATTKDKPTSDKTKVLGREFISRPCSVRPVAPVTAGEKDPKKLLKLNQNQDGTGNDAQDRHVVHSDVPPTPKPGVEESTSPKKKRRKTENGGEIDGCKRCNCKKSKCLKLYCECFAAGVYCVEPCSCQGCLNKPIHEETVLGTRKQIESRNPLAFAPKVIRTSDHEQEMGEESNKTPASARHKRGCNCKKSNCLKKYCECYQGGVGCSFSCRCEGCKNAFGRKDGSEEIDYDEELDACENSRLKPDDGNEIAEVPNGELNHLSESTLPFTPFPICSSSVKFPFLSSGKPPRSSTLSQMSRAEIPQAQCKEENNVQAVQDDDTPEILGGNPSPCTSVKTASPNGKRVSLPLNGLGMSPNFKGGRKLILKSIPSFPTLSSETSSSTHLSSSALS